MGCQSGDRACIGHHSHFYQLLGFDLSDNQKLKWFGLGPLVLRYSEHFLKNTRRQDLPKIWLINAVRSAASSYAEVRMVAGSRPVLVIA